MPLDLPKESISAHLHLWSSTEILQQIYQLIAAWIFESGQLLQINFLMANLFLRFPKSPNIPRNDLHALLSKGSIEIHVSSKYGKMLAFTEVVSKIDELRKLGVESGSNTEETSKLP